VLVVLLAQLVRQDLLELQEAQVQQALLVLQVAQAGGPTGPTGDTGATTGAQGHWLQEPQVQLGPTGPTATQQDLLVLQAQSELQGRLALLVLQDQ
jgi:hypothetical protein